MPEVASFMEFSMGPISIKPIWPIKHWPDFYFYFFPLIPGRYPLGIMGERERKNRFRKNTKPFISFFKMPGLCGGKIPTQ